jgi:putative transposase
VPRIARVVVPDVPHHVTQRGNRGADVFFTEKDRQRYLELLGRYSAERGLGVVAYCLMTNHVHMIAVPPESSVLGEVLKPVHLRYAQHVNWTQHLRGRLWQGRFFSCPMDDAHTLAAIRYVEQNPVRAGLVSRAEEYPWSSAAAHAGKRGDALLSDPTGVIESAGVEDWGAWLREREDVQVLNQLREKTRTGRPLGSADFAERLEQVTRRLLQPQRGGRPRKRAGSRRKPG